MANSSSNSGSDSLTGSLTDITGIAVGHWTDRAAATGCTVILCPQGAVAGVDVRGGAPGTRETDLLNPVCMVQEVHAVLLSGGSAFGLAAADGVMRWLEERGHGFDVGVTRVPIVPAAILFDLTLGRADVRPDAAAGYAACEAAATTGIEEGSVGAGTGATVGKMLGPGRTMKGGVGMASLAWKDGARVAALAAVNAVGDVMDPRTGTIVAGARHTEDGALGDTLGTVRETVLRAEQHPPESEPGRRDWPGQRPLENTTLVVVATNVKLSKTGATKVAQMAHDGLARAIRPVHTAGDGDSVFALSLGELPGDAGVVGMLAADVVAQAIVRAVESAESLHGVPACRDLEKGQ